MECARIAIANQIIEAGLERWPATVEGAKRIHETYIEGETVVRPGDRVFDNNDLFPEFGPKVIRRAQPYDALFDRAEEIVQGRTDATGMFVLQLMIANDLQGTVGLALTGTKPCDVARLMRGDPVRVSQEHVDLMGSSMEMAAVTYEVVKGCRQARRREQRKEKKSRRRAPQWDNASARR